MQGSASLVMSTLFSLGGLPTQPQNPPFLEDQFVSLCLASLLLPVRLGRAYQEHKVPADIALSSLRPASPPPPTTRGRQSGGQPPRQNGQHPTAEIHPHLQTPGKTASRTPQETMETRRCRNRSNDLIHGGR